MEGAGEDASPLNGGAERRSSPRNCCSRIIGTQDVPLHGNAPRVVRDPVRYRRGRHGGGLSRPRHILKRDVALKILPDSFAADAERLARFQREAEVLASLNHPNIAAIYGLETPMASRPS